MKCHSHFYTLLHSQQTAFMDNLVDSSILDYTHWVNHIEYTSELDEIKLDATDIDYRIHKLVSYYINQYERILQCLITNVIRNLILCFLAKPLIMRIFITRPYLDEDLLTHILISPLQKFLSFDPSFACYDYINDAFPHKFYYRALKQNLFFGLVEYAIHKKTHLWIDTLHWYNDITECWTFASKNNEQELIAFQWTQSDIFTVVVSSSLWVCPWCHVQQDIPRVTCRICGTSKKVIKCWVCFNKPSRSIPNYTVKGLYTYYNDQDNQPKNAIQRTAEYRGFDFLLNFIPNICRAFLEGK